ncbi:MAG: amino acid adenylation domain-containing protein [Bacteroidetes bacterium]|nr:amino acid adenylation domain-containing protein [Bacteroidota bacterium]
MQINILEYLSRTLKNKAEKTAIIDGSQSVTFIELDKKARILASHIINFSSAFNKPVAVYLPKSINSVVADIAITYSGNAYMNLDVKSPSIRIGNILELIQPVALITTVALSGQIKELNNELPLILIDEMGVSPVECAERIEQRLKMIIDTDPLCIINTSGSTGTPKGVVLHHKSFIDFTEWAIETLKISEDEIVGSLSPLVFDIYSFELCMLMAKGSTITLLPDSLAPYPARILSLLQNHNVSFLFWVPTIMVNIANMDLLTKISLPGLKTIWFAGEVFPTQQFNYWKKNLPDVKFVNLYGPIEITLDCTYFIVEREIRSDEPLPIGYPCRNTDVLILKDNNELAGVNEEGELCVRGTSLALGYYNNPEKTAQAFVQNPLNNSYPEIIYRTGDIVWKNQTGEIIFKGRKDSLVKHLGYRIELGEIEHVIINTLKIVSNACVVYNHSKKEITLFYEDRHNIPVADMKRSIASVLPKYMVPSVFYNMEMLPRNVNGKIDRLKLLQEVNV